MQRTTQQRTAIEAAFQRNGPLSIEDILQEGRKIVPSLNQATVYRNLKVLLREGRIRQFPHPVHGLAYERNTLEHHHHFLCRKCRRTFDIPGCALNRDFSLPPGYIAEEHDLFLFGLCPDCAPRKHSPHKDMSI